MKKTEITM